MGIPKLIILLIFLFLLGCTSSHRICEDSDEWNKSYRLATDKISQKIEEGSSKNEIFHHKSLFPIQPIEYFGTFLLAIIVMLTNVAGIGGGGAVIPILMMLEFKVNVAVAIWNVIIFVGALTRFIMELNESHPNKKAPVIDYGVVILMLPWILIGAFLGVQMNIIAPQFVILITLSIVLIFVSYKSTKKGIELYQKDMLKQQKKERQKSQDLLENHKSRDNEEGKMIEMQHLKPEDSWVDSILIKSTDTFNTKELK